MAPLPIKKSQLPTPSSSLPPAVRPERRPVPANVLEVLPAQLALEPILEGAAPPYRRVRIGVRGHQRPEAAIVQSLWPVPVRPGHGLAAVPRLTLVSLVAYTPGPSTDRAFLQSADSSSKAILVLGAPSAPSPGFDDGVMAWATRPSAARRRRWEGGAGLHLCRSLVESDLESCTLRAR